MIFGRAILHGKQLRFFLFVHMCVISPTLFLEDCFFRLEAEEKEKKFSSPGYPTSYPAKSRCQWQIRASMESAIFVSFPFFHIEDDCSDDFVSIYDSLSPDDSQAITE